MEIKAPLIYRTTPQWFISMKNDLRNKAIKAINDTTFIQIRERQAAING